MVLRQAGLVAGTTRLGLVGGSTDPSGGENRSALPSIVEDLAARAALSRGLLLLRGVDGYVQELAVTVALPLESGRLAVGVLLHVPSVEGCPALHHLELAPPQSELERFELAIGDAKDDRWRGVVLGLESVHHGLVVQRHGFRRPS